MGMVVKLSNVLKAIQVQRLISIEHDDGCLVIASPGDWACYDDEKGFVRIVTDDEFQDKYMEI